MSCSPILQSVTLRRKLLGCRRLRPPDTGRCRLDGRESFRTAHPPPRLCQRASVLGPVKAPLASLGGCAGLDWPSAPSGGGR
jgi:hypothetical protein